MDPFTAIQRKYRLLLPTMTERARRLWAGAEAEALGWGGVALVSRATGMAISTVRKGRDEVRSGKPVSGIVRERRGGAGRKPLEKKDPGLVSALEAMVDPLSRGDPESPLRWTAKSTRRLARELTKAGHPVSAQTIGSLLRSSGYSLQGTSKMKEGQGHPDRDAQFEYLNARAKQFMALNVPVVSIDSKKKEQVGEYANPGREWQPKGKAVEVMTYDFPDPKGRKAVPYGIYDVANNVGYINVGTSHDTSTFAAHSLERWWLLMGRFRYPDAKELFVTADCGGSNSSKSFIWKRCLQSIADRQGLTIHVSHFPPGTSKWNKIEHRLFSFITLNWRGRPLVTYETIVSLIGSTTTRNGLQVAAELDVGHYPVGVAAKGRLRGLALALASFHGDWNYSLRPRTPEEIAAAQRVGRGSEKAEAKWKPIIEEQLKSGLNPSQFCRKRGINYGSYIGARRRALGPMRPNKLRAKAPARWALLVAEQQKSGLNSWQFCKARKMSYASFIDARRKLVGLIHPKTQPAD